MKRNVLFLCLSVVYLLACNGSMVGHSEHVDDKKAVAKKIDTVVENLKHTAFDVLVTNAVIDKIWDELIVKSDSQNESISSKRVNWLARTAVFSNQLQSLFKSPNRYHNTAYAAWSCDDDSLQWHIRNKGVSIYEVTSLKRYRLEAMDLAREHLRHSDNLWRIYESKRGYLSTKLAGMSNEDRLLLEGWLTAAAGGIEASLDSRFQEAYIAHISTEDELYKIWSDLYESRDNLRVKHDSLIADLPEGDLKGFLKLNGPNIFDGGDGREFQARLESFSTTDHPEIINYCMMVDHYLDMAEQSKFQFERYKKSLVGLGKISPDLYASFFAQRRRSEGGEALVKMYLKIANDFLSMIKVASSNDSEPPVKLISFEVHVT